jgi:hypothetical protein
VGVTDESARQTVLFSDLFDKPLVAAFDQPHNSSDGGAVLLAAVDRRLGLTDALAGVLTDPRDPRMVRHHVRDLIAQRVFGLACGYPDAKDSDALAHDPVQKLLLGRDPVTGARLASQPTLSRGENRVSPRLLRRLGSALTDTVLRAPRRRFGRRVRRITLDLDVTDAPPPGAQPLTFFTGYADTWGSLPLLACVPFDDEPEPSWVAAILRPGNAQTPDGVLGLRKRRLPRLWQPWPDARVRGRLDAGVAHPLLFDVRDVAGVEYVVGVPENAGLARAAAPPLDALRDAAAADHVTTTYGAGLYQAERWPAPRRLILKADLVCLPGRDPTDNPRLVVTNGPGDPQTIDEQISCRRGERENRLTARHDGLQIDRTRGSRFLANHRRVRLTAAAYALLQALRHRAAGTRYARAQVPTLRARFLTLGAQLVVSARRVVLPLPARCPSRDVWRRGAPALGALSGSPPHTTPRRRAPGRRRCRRRHEREPARPRATAARPRRPLHRAMSEASTATRGADRGPPATRHE